MSKSLMRKAIDHMTERPSKIIHNELSEGAVETLLHKDIRSSSRNISAEIKSVLSFNIPKTRE